jgi:DNA-binding transcriptional regulator LsrR (DeoR family)
VSLSPEQRAQVLYLHHVESVSAILIATMTGLSVSVVRKVVQESRRQEMAAVDWPNPRRPSSQGRIERQIRTALAASSKKGATS